MVFLNSGFIFKYAVSFVLYVRGRGCIMHFFLLSFVKMYCIFYVLLVRKINFFCFPFTNVLCSICGSGEGSARPWGAGPTSREGPERKGGDGRVSLEQQPLPGSHSPLPRVISSRLSWLRFPGFWVLAVFCHP